MASTPAISELFPTAAAAGPAATPNELGQEDFLELMVAQLENQDPTKPMDNFEFLSQIAQFGTVDGIQGLRDGFAELSGALASNRTLQAASLVGRSVVTGSNLGQLSAEGPLQATVELPAGATEATLYIEDASGQLVHSRPLVGSGQQTVAWDGTGPESSGGAQLPPGAYRVSAGAMVDGAPVTLPAYAHAVVSSVSLDQAGGAVTLSLDSGADVSVESLQRIF